MNAKNIMIDNYTLGCAWASLLAMPCQCAKGGPELYINQAELYIKPTELYINPWGPIYLKPCEITHDKGCHALCIGMNHLQLCFNQVGPAIEL